jgi:hypothetical protein
MENQTRHVISCIFGVLVACILTAACGWLALFPPVRYDCRPRDNDPEEYMVAICRYLNQEQIRVGDWSTFDIEDIREAEFNGRAAILIHLDCCHTGDTSYIDRETGEVLGYVKGAW